MKNIFTDPQASSFVAMSRVTSTGGKTLTDGVVAELHAQLQQRLEEPWTLNDMAAFCFLSPFYFCRQFKHVTGVTPYQYLIRMRINRARQMFEQPVGGQPRQVAEVAYACGFSDQAHLNRHFKRLVGTTPGRYARQQLTRIQSGEDRGRYEWAPTPSSYSVSDQDCA
ncbi:MAG: AraC family transcriptional regulator [Planctomycetota bacterium]